MNNPILQSEGFERAAYALQRALENGVHADNFDNSVEKLSRIVDRFEASVDRLVTAMEKQ